MSKKNALIPIEPQQNPYDALTDERHVAAVDMRVEGYRLRYIAERLKLSENWIAEWFERGGVCHEAYKFRRAQWLTEQQELFANIQEEIKNGATDAIVTLKKNARKGNTLAAIKLLEFAGFQSTQTINVTPTKVTIEYVNPPTESPTLDGPRTADPVPTDPETT